MPMPPVSCGCEGLFAPYCDEIGTYPTCHQYGGVWSCPTRGKVCNDFNVHESCKDYGGTHCTIRQVSQ